MLNTAWVVLVLAQAAGYAIAAAFTADGFGLIEIDAAWIGPGLAGIITAMALTLVSHRVVRDDERRRNQR